LSRIKACRALLAREHLDSLLITNPINILYLIERPILFDHHFNGVLLITERDAVLLADFRYFELAANANLDAEIKLIKDKPLFDAILDWAESNSLNKLGFEARHMNAAVYLQLHRHLGERLVPKQKLVESIRAVKDAAELEAITKAAAIAEGVFPRILKLLKPGVAECDIALEMDFMLRRAGAEKVSFEPIVASGPNSAIPHAQAGARRLQAGDAVVLDFGCVYQGYCSDMTRTVFIGRADSRLKKLYQLVKEGQRLALDGLEAGMAGGAADALARDYFKLHRQAEKFGHSLGHGIGLDVHELPTLSKTSTQKLLPGTVFTIEPGLYLSGLGGVRIEDMVVMEANGPDILTTLSKDLIEL